MPLVLPPTENSRQLTALARGKAQRECSRGDHDLRLLLAHIKILDQLEHNAAEVYETENRRKSEKSQVQHSQEYERKRPNLHKRESSAVSEKDELDELFIAPSTVATAPALVTIEELDDDDDDWNA